ncbi:MAG: hypothetical protein KBA60_08255 [Flavobacteriales bacterium]|nr:hypothetical protein [Flavobacteriales bacterium]MBP7155985.1 hypothetical protein [Flavobacteriales bacterium]HQV75153.1 hypothetical protein [Flavobacteriales bacterium]HQW40785.1 hypothetical protein [Flavobacteriales bacterium]
MSLAKHSWRNSRQPFDRLVLGAIVAFSFTLVAFEWRLPRTDLHFANNDFPEDDLPTEILPIVILKKQAASRPAPKERSKTRIILADPDPVVVVDPTPDPGPDLGPVTDPAPFVPPNDLRSTETVDLGPMPWGSVGVNPYFMECLKRDPEHLVFCTEDRISDHLQRHFRIPNGVRGHVRTTVTFLIDTHGEITKIVCAPKVDAKVLAEIERTLRSMPQFVPGSQGGIPVPVYYQIPLSLRSE